MSLNNVNIEKIITAMKNNTDGWPWYWYAYGEKCYAFACVEAYPLDDAKQFPEPGSKLELQEHANGKDYWTGENGTAMLIESEICNIESQNGDTVCSFVAAAHATLMKDNLCLNFNF